MLKSCTSKFRIRNAKVPLLSVTRTFDHRQKGGKTQDRTWDDGSVNSVRSEGSFRGARNLLDAKFLPT